jgi:hypothetical protein
VPQKPIEETSFTFSDTVPLNQKRRVWGTDYVGILPRFPEATFANLAVNVLTSDEAPSFTPSHTFDIVVLTQGARDLSASITELAQKKVRVIIVPTLQPPQLRMANHTVVIEGIQALTLVGTVSTTELTLTPFLAGSDNELLSGSVREIALDTLLHNLPSELIVQSQGMQQLHIAK